VERAVERAGVEATFWDGSFAGFASIIAASRLYVGYDSAGQHIAAAAGVPLVSVFAGFPARACSTAGGRLAHTAPWCAWSAPTPPRCWSGCAG